MKALATNYSMHFNNKYDRVGPLFQGIYKCVAVETDAQLMHLNRYIHLNPSKLLTRDQPLREYRYSSYRNYLGLVKQDWLLTGELLGLFPGKSPMADYRTFVEGAEESVGVIDDLVIEDIDEG